MTFSRVIEVDLTTKQIVWKYQEKREYEFYSPRISNAQRLPNGNTLQSRSRRGDLRQRRSGLNEDVKVCDKGLRVIVDETKKTMRLSRDVPYSEVADLSILRDAQRELAGK